MMSYEQSGLPATLPAATGGRTQPGGRTAGLSRFFIRKTSSGIFASQRQPGENTAFRCPEQERPDAVVPHAGRGRMERFSPLRLPGRP